MGKKRLLIIEDDIDVQEMLTVYFEGQDYEVLHASEGAEGIAISRSKFPNLILLDVMLPDMDGFDVCRALRTTTLTKYIPITFLTQRDARADKVAGLELGADDYVTKPFDMEELRLRVQSSIRRATRDHLHEPRTGLPTGPMIRAELTRLSGQAGWHFLDAEIENFKELREAYSFMAADAALELAVQVITEVVSQMGTPDDFVGTPEEARFVVFTHTADADTFTAALRERFSERAKSLYNFMDAERGYVVLNAGTPDERHESLVRLEVRPLAGTVAVPAVTAAADDPVTAPETVAPPPTIAPPPVMQPPADPPAPPEPPASSSA
ncbi:response regulator [Aggregatilinea lenta]|uniref:response regulator n=1 Tax=Aggregatilinea lenta TaxID=913108 RepID=UPI0013C2CBCF|nr:response regulator [Aggregatilinea lenta]